VDLPTFAITTPMGVSTVNCPADANVQPTDAGVVTDVCGNVITPTVVAPTAVACEGDMVWTFTYTDCAGNAVDWIHTYTIDIPAFTIPYANDASTVNCSADGSIQPTDPGVVTDQCGNVLTPVVVAPTAVACEGDMIWTFTYTDCAGNTADWTYTYTIDLIQFTIPFANGASIVNCSADAVQPANPGVVTDVCGNVLTPVITTPTVVACEGDMIWTFTYTDCAGNTVDWLYTYTVDLPAFVLPANGASNVECLAQVAVPIPPVMTDLCGNTIIPTMTENADPVCEGDKIYTFTYTDCAGNTADWTYTYTIDIVTSPVVPANETEAVVCFADIYIPTPPAVTDVCGNAIVPVMTESADPICVGDKVYTFTYTDCAGNATIWTYTFSINDNILPTASNPAPLSVPGSMNVPAPDVTVVIDEADNCDPNPLVTWVDDVLTGTPCVDEVIIRTYMVTDACGNMKTVTQEIIIEAIFPPIDAGIDQIICQGEFVTLTVGNPMGITPIVWTSPVFAPVIDNVPFAPTTTGDYTVTLDNLGCISTDVVTVIVEELPVASFIGDVLSGCQPLTVVFTNTSTSTAGLDNCTWAFEGTTQTLNGCGDLTYTFEEGGLYDVTLTTQSVNGCSASVTYTDYIYVEDNPVASFSPSSTELLNISTEVDFNNTSTGATDYVWIFGDNSASSTVENPTHVFPGEQAGSYTVELFAYSPLGCVDSTLIVISVAEETIFYVPNTFTPDGDAHNQYFRPVFTSGYDPYDFQLLIFNRWGEVIWESHDASAGWDGTYDGFVVQDGVYSWKIEFKTSQNDERKVVVGHVNVLR
ncbi:MAG: PKD domain-containing protein, partial [Flavobacteriales bacterium]|nr:PKD domain-containing protein [Flavobacteriales bacterium]